MKQMTDTAGTNPEPLPPKERLKQRLLDHQDLEEVFKVSRIYNWQRKGLLPFTQFGGRTYYDAEDLEAVIRKNKSMKWGKKTSN